MHGRDQEKDAVKTLTYDDQIFGLTKFFISGREWTSGCGPWPMPSREEKEKEMQNL